MYKKTYVEVVARFYPDGKIRPSKILWHDGKIYTADEIFDVCKAASLKAGGVGIRYTCRIGRKITYLFLEENRWFVEEICN